jgi:hypothetical protein
MREPSKWARWQWAEGLGRWHAIVGTAEGVTTLACGRIRKPPAVTAGRPGDEKCCPTCRRLDDLRIAFTPETVETPLRVAVPAGGERRATPAAEPFERRVVPVGEDLRALAARALPCDCNRCATEETTAEREAILAARATLTEQAKAGFEAYLREKEASR